MSVYAFTALARGLPRTSLLPLVLNGRIQEAASLAESLLALREAGASEGAEASELATLCGDLMLAQDRNVEAEEMYRRAVEAATHAPRGQVRVLCCRNTGILSLYKQRFGTAVACFRRLADDADATHAQKVEALCGQALAHHGVGQKAQAMEALQAATLLAAEAQDGVDAEPLQTLTHMLRVELLVHQEIRNHTALRDHVFWQTPGATAPTVGEPSDALDAIEASLAAQSNSTLLTQWLHQQRALVHAVRGQFAAMQSLHEHLAVLRQAGLANGERQARLESALVAIARQNGDMARSLLEPLCGRSGERHPQRWDFELSYCLAKMCELAGRSEECIRHYQRYALESVQCVRTETQDDRNTVRRAAPTADGVKDEVEMSLPAKYRRAYRYLLEHLNCAALSTREIAEHIGVTNRTLQAVFRTHLGMTPVEVMRRCRVERIREDILKAEAGGLTVTQAAKRWGIPNRSTLVSTYRRYFSETPAQTLAHRRDESSVRGVRGTRFAVTS